LPSEGQRHLCASLVGGEASRRGLRENDAGRRGLQVGPQLFRGKVRHDLTELDSVAFIDEHVADPPDQVETELYLTPTLDGRSPKHLSNDVAAGDDMSMDRYRSDDTLSHEERHEEHER
jgi:hypothetical protein